MKDLLDAVIAGGVIILCIIITLLWVLGRGLIIIICLLYEEIARIAIKIKNWGEKL